MNDPQGSGVIVVVLFGAAMTLVVAAIWWLT